MFIHSKAGRDTKIWVNCQIREGVRIGQKCIIGKDTYIDENVVIGNEVKIQEWRIYIPWSNYKGQKYLLDLMLHFPMTCTRRAFNNEWKVYDTIVEEGASVGANSTIICGHTIGTYAMIGAGSVVAKDIPPHALVMGNPAQIKGYVCKCGNKLVNSICDKCGFVLGEKMKRWIILKS